MLPGASPLVFGCLLAGGISLSLAGYARHRRQQPGAASFALLMLGATVWSLSYGVALAVFDPALRLALEVPIEIGKALIAPAWLAFTLGYTGRSGYVRWWTAAAIMLFPAATLLVIATPSLQPLVWTNFRITPTLAAATVSYDPGLWHYAHATYGYVLVGAGTALLVDTLLAHGSLYRDQTAALVVGSAVPTVAHVKRTFQLGPLAAVDFTPMALAVTGLTFGYALFRFDLLDVVPATSHRGRRTAVEDLGVGVAIVTADDRLVELNTRAKRLFGDVDPGTPLSTFVPPGATEDGTFDTVVDGRRRTLEAVPSAIDGRGAVGRTIAFHDVTEREARRQRLEVLNRVLRHNLRNEMAIVTGYADRLAESLPEEDARLARTVGEHAAALASLGEKARDLDRMVDAVDDATSTVSLADVAADVVDDVVPAAASAEADVDLEVDVPSKLTVETNEQVLRTVLATAVENAVEHNGAPSPWVRVSARTATADGGPGFGDGVVVEVCDDGPGIPDHELAVVEDGHETPLKHGSGLGLWILHWGSQWLRADVDIETRTDGTDRSGTTVRLRL
jgi:signal transduction histidine kinase